MEAAYERLKSPNIGPAEGHDAGMRSTPPPRSKGVASVYGGTMNAGSLGQLLGFALEYPKISRNVICCSEQVARRTIILTPVSPSSCPSKMHGLFVLRT